MSVEAVYQERARRFAGEEAEWARWDKRLAHLRIIAFSITALLLGIAWLGGGGRVWYAAGALAFSGFVGLVGYHDYVWRRLAASRELRRINEQALARLHRRWTDLPLVTVEIADRDQPLADDLDLFGRGCLFQLVCTAGTGVGRETLRDWLLAPAPSAEISRRQQAVRELAARLELRQQLELSGRLLVASTAGPEQFAAWAEGQPWLTHRAWLIWATRLLPAGLLAAFLMMTAGVLSPEAGGLTVTGLLLVNAALSVLFSGTIHDIFKLVSTRNGEVRRYLDMFAQLYAMPETTSQLAALRRQLTEQGGGVLRRMSSLQRIMWLANVSQSPLLFLLFYIPMQLIVLWDFHVLLVLEEWQGRYGRHVRAWFAALGQFEALASLAALAHDQPQWAFPEVDPQADRFRAAALGHPLLPEQVRVGNDVEVGPPGTFLLVSGSNMSGKSTLLRSIGTNALLAQAGAPVCAARLTMPPLVVATSMRIHDSLQDGVSFYMAQLQRLKQIVDQAHRFAQRNDQRLLYLLDEILQGTNSKERHIAVVRVVAHLLECRAIGAISTHDVELAATPPIDRLCRAVHFRETLDEAAERPMTFDYRLREGVCTTTNALKLLKIVGLENPS